MTPALPRTETDYRSLTTAQQDEFDRLMEQADTAGPGDAYHQAMTEAALTAGLPVPASRDIARCSCLNDAGGCGCGAIFDSHALGVVVTATNAPNRNLSELQCPTCGHDHPRPITD
ncbi:hypothetical protein [Streptomyces prasinopilosus]|uniref:hypothetical protein n=1 Tax=Streptomyces prasinopilosus TaxID=67344 RepID=UPI0012FEB714|nr:hypothetical protein [Streptomyces prasinopilosus]